MCEFVNNCSLYVVLPVLETKCSYVQTKTTQNTQIRLFQQYTFVYKVIVYFTTRWAMFNVI